MSGTPHDWRYSPSAEKYSQEPGRYSPGVSSAVQCWVMLTLISVREFAVACLHGEKHAAQPASGKVSGCARMHAHV